MGEDEGLGIYSVASTRVQTIKESLHQLFLPVDQTVSGAAV